MIQNENNALGGNQIEEKVDENLHYAFIGGGDSFEQDLNEERLPQNK